MRQIGRIAVVMLALVSAGCGSQDRDASRRTPEVAGAKIQDYNITPVEGPSWLKHLGLQVPQTKMGEMGRSGQIPATYPDEPPAAAGVRSRPLNSIKGRMMSVTGADLYRLNCQSCHGPDGTGDPPEINSLIGPVQGTSAALIESRMKERGMPIDNELAKQLADQAESQIRDRLRKGGKKMPPFPHLRGDEVTALMGYLDQLANVPSAANQSLLVTESAARVGELVVKGTCHICHDATGPGRRANTSLAGMPRFHSLDSVLEQVHYGSRHKMELMMPAMPYFTDNQIAAAYAYLRDYPPRP